MFSATKGSSTSMYRLSVEASTEYSLKLTPSIRSRVIVTPSMNSFIAALFFSGTLVVNYTAVITEDLGISRTAFSAYSAIRSLCSIVRLPS